MDCSLPGSSIHRTFQARVLEWVAICFSRGSSWPRGWTQVSCIAGRHFTVWATREVPLNSKYLGIFRPHCGQEHKCAFDNIVSLFLLLFSSTLTFSSCIVKSYCFQLGFFFGIYCFFLIPLLLTSPSPFLIWTITTKSSLFLLLSFKPSFKF